MFKTKASRQQFEQLILRRAKDSIAYVESENKKEYLIGVKLATVAFFENMKEPLKILQNTIKNRENEIKRLKSTLDPIADYVMMRIED